MTPTSPASSDAPPPDVADALAALPPAERAALEATWRLAAPPPAPAPLAHRKAQTWAVLQQHAGAPARRAARPPAMRRRRLALAGALAALLVAAAGTYALVAPAPQSWHGGATATRVLLPDGSAAVLAPGAVLTRRPGSGRAFALTGTATFSVVPDAAHPFTVQAPHARVTVLGTQFTIRDERGSATRVVVARGRVAVEAPGAPPVELAPGEQTVARPGRAPLVRAQPQSPRAVFAFSDAPLALVAGEVEALFGVPVAVPPALREARLTITRHGPLALADVMQSICAPLGLGFRRAGEGYEIFQP